MDRKDGFRTGLLAVSSLALIGQAGFAGAVQGVRSVDNRLAVSSMG